VTSTVCASVDDDAMSVIAVTINAERFMVALRSPPEPKVVMTSLPSIVRMPPV
jgi:hypothetical protein